MRCSRVRGNSDTFPGTTTYGKDDTESPLNRMNGQRQSVHQQGGMLTEAEFVWDTRNRAIAQSRHDLAVARTFDSEASYGP